MVLQNYVILQPGVPARMHFTSHEIVEKTITDPRTGKPKPISALEFRVDELNGKPVVSTYSTLSQKHAADFTPYLSGQRYRGYDFIVTVMGHGDLRQYQTQAVPRA